MFILASDTGNDYDEVRRGYAAYREYLQANEKRFPPGAYALATSSWYFDFTDHRCPHDGWLEEMRLTEKTSPEEPRQRVAEMTVRLLGAYHDLYVEFTYPRVYRYELALTDGEWGHRDWRYDELRLSDEGHLIHEIEWCGPTDTARWQIVASDVLFRIEPIDQPEP